MPMKLEAHMANMYSMCIDRKRSTMKSDAYFFCPASAGGAVAADGVGGAAAEGGVSDVCWAAAGVAATAAVATPLRNSRRPTGSWSDCFMHRSVETVSRKLWLMAEG